MTIWEKALTNMQKGSEKLMATAATFSERVQAELNIVRLRIRVDNVQTSMHEEYQTIGRTIVELHNSAAMPKMAEQLLQDEKIATALVALTALEQELDKLQDEIKCEQSVYSQTTKQSGEAAP